MEDGAPERPLFAAIYDPATAFAERTLLRPHREYPVRDLSGTVLDLGAGTGAMFDYLPDTADASLHAIEPDRYMRQQAISRASDLDLDTQIRDAGAESLPYADNQFDTVPASMVFCTVPDVETALSDVSPVLGPGGGFRFFEHVADDGWRGRVQTVLVPLWKRLAGAVT